MGFTYQLLTEYDFGGDLMYVDDVEKLMFAHFANNTVSSVIEVTQVAKSYSCKTKTANIGVMVTG